MFNGINSSKCNLNFGEQFILTSLLKETSPDCSILIGDTKCEELIQYYSNIVFSINSIKQEQKSINKENLVNFNGVFKNILPIITDEISKGNAYINFIFINESIEVIKETFNVLKSYKVEQPLFIVINCSYNQLIRKELSYFKWNEINNLKWMDLNFINTNLENSDDITLINNGLAVICLSNI